MKVGSNLGLGSLAGGSFGRPRCHSTDSWPQKGFDSPSGEDKINKAVVTMTIMISRSKTITPTVAFGLN